MFGTPMLGSVQIRFCRLRIRVEVLIPRVFRLSWGFITPEKFDYYKNAGLKKGLRYVESGPLVRSSYHAEKHI